MTMKKAINSKIFRSVKKIIADHRDTYTLIFVRFTDIIIQK